MARLERALRLLLCVTVFLMMAITAVDVFARYLLSAPLRGAFEIVTLLLATSIFIALPLVTRADEHISVDLLKPLLRGIGGSLQRLTILALSTAILAVITVQLWRHAGLLASAGHVTGFLEWRLAPVVYLMSALCGVTVLVYLGMIAEHVRGLHRTRHTAGDASPKSSS